MKPSITSKPNKRGVRLWAAAFWLLVWQAAAMLVGHEILLASPIRAAARFFELAATLAFWRAALYSLARILLGDLLGTVLGMLLAALAARFRRVRELLAPLMAVIRAIPVASFVIVALIWVPSRGLSVLIATLIVLPLIYTSTLQDIERADPKLAEVAQVFRMRPSRRLLYLYALPMLESLSAPLTTAMGLAWKSGVAAELISIPRGSIGERLYTAKVYLMTGDLFAWTFLIVCLSAGCARLLSVLLRQLRRCLERGSF